MCARVERRGRRGKLRRGWGQRARWLRRARARGADLEADMWGSGAVGTGWQWEGNRWSGGEGLDEESAVGCDWVGGGGEAEAATKKSWSTWRRRGGSAAQVGVELVWLELGRSVRVWEESEETD